MGLCSSLVRLLQGVDNYIIVCYTHIIKGKENIQ
nr:MAG TPA: hypothetical protein [Caudoviricetes sp.]